MPKSFQNSTSSTQIAHQDIPFDPIFDEQPVLNAATGAIWIKSGTARLTYTSAGAYTIPAPDQDGQDITIVNEGGFAHTITTVSPGFNNNTSYTVVTMAPNVGDVLNLRSADGIWWILIPAQSKNLNTQIQLLSASSGAVTIKNGLVAITYSGGAGAYTIIAPTAGLDDGAEFTINTESAQAHTLACATNGFNNKGSAGTITWSAALGNSAILHARNGIWWVDAKNGTTVA